MAKGDDDRTRAEGAVTDTDKAIVSRAKANVREMYDRRKWERSWRRWVDPNQVDTYRIAGARAAVERMEWST